VNKNADIRKDQGAAGFSLRGSSTQLTLGRHCGWLPVDSEIPLADKHSYATTSFAYLSLQWIVEISAP